MSFVMILVSFIPFSGSGQSFSIGLIADCQYRGEPGDGIRKYPISDKKLSECVAHFNSMDLEYVIHLGDFIDKDLSSFDVVGPIYSRLSAPRYHVLGNHDFSVDDEKKDHVPNILGVPSRYYDFSVHKWRFIVLDGNDISFHAYPNESDRYREAEHYYADKNISSPKWNGALGKSQMDWLEDVLEKANKQGEQVIIFCHFPIYPEDVHNLWNANEVIELVEDYPCVKAYINGHNHAGNYGIREGIHYLTLRGMVDTEETSYAVMKIRKRRLVVKGFGREQERVLKLKR
jgi:calcineurin-like phosphoesterase family protein